MLPEMQPQHYRLRWHVATLAFVLVITFFPYIFSGKTFLPSDFFDTMTEPYNAKYGPPQAQNHYVFDAIAQELPYKIQTKEAFARNSFSYWNPYILGGYPQYAETLGNNFDPFNILLVWFSPEDVITFETIIELLIAGIAMMLLLRYCGISPIINLIFSSGYMLNSMFISSAHYRCLLACFCWIPLVVLMIVKYFQTQKKENILYASGFLCLAFLGGNYQTAVFVAFIVSIIVFFYPSYKAPTSFIKRLSIVSIIGMFGFLLSAIMWLPALELLFQTLFRGGSLHSTNIFDSYTITERFLTIPLLIFFFFPEVLGNAQTFNLRKIANIEIINFNGAIGFLPMLFALWGCFILWKDKGIRPFIIIAVSGLVLPIATPLFSVVYHRFFIISSFAFCVIGATALQQFISEGKSKYNFSKYFFFTKIVYSILLGVLTLTCVYIGLFYQTTLQAFTSKVLPKIGGSAFGVGNESWMIGRVEKTLHYYSSFSPELWIPIIGAGIMLLILSYYQKAKINDKTMLYLFLMLTCLQLIITMRTWFPSVDQKQFPIYPENVITQFLKQNTINGRYMIWRDPSKDQYILAENAPNVYKVYDLHGYESCSNRSMSLFFYKYSHYDTSVFRLLGLANVRYLLTGKAKLNTPLVREVFSSDNMTIYENLLTKPRAYIAYQSKIVESDSAAALELLRPNFYGTEAIFIKNNAPLENITSEQGQYNIDYKSLQSEEINLSVETTAKGVLILTDTHYPGWKCYVNGQRTAIYQTNYCMRGIILGPGHSDVEFRFEPDVFTIGAYISGFAIFLAFIGILYTNNTNSKEDAKALH
jgi:hypothetical protein